MYKSDKFFEKIPYEVSYDDVLLRPSGTDLTIDEIELNSKFTSSVPLKLPIASAAMDTVTNAEMAIAVAEHGGIGVIPSSYSPDEQKREVRAVKLFMNGKIEKPITFFDDQTIGEVLQACTDKEHHFRTFPIIDRNGTFAGLLTGKHFTFTKDRNSTVGSVMTPKEQVITAEKRTGIKQAFNIMMAHMTTTLPLVDSKGRIGGLYLFSDVDRIINQSHYANLDKNGRLYVAAAVPTDSTAIDRVEEMKRYLDVIVIDSAQGDSKYAFETLQALKKHYPEKQVVVGNITSPQSAKKLAKLGADAIKVGQGPGSICTTRQQLGTGYPQLSAVHHCKKAIRGSGVPVIADGGIKEFGDINKAIAAGADSVMLGSLLAGTAQAPGEVITLENGVRAKVYRGMGSSEAMKDSAAARKRYQASKDKPLPEGVKSYLPYKGDVTEILTHFRQAIRRGMFLTDAKNIKALQTDVDFVLLSPGAIAESGAHITNRSVNVL